MERHKCKYQNGQFKSWLHSVSLKMANNPPSYYRVEATERFLEHVHTGAPAYHLCITKNNKLLRNGVHKLLSQLECAAYIFYTSIRNYLKSCVLAEPFEVNSPHI